MDNDNTLKKLAANAYRKSRFILDYAFMGVTKEPEGNSLIAEYLDADSPFLVGRFGAVEMHCVSRWMNHEECTEAELEQAQVAAGIFPTTRETIEKFCRTYAHAIEKCDVVGVWEVSGEKKAIKQFCPNAKLIPSRSIEPYYFENPWSAKLAEKKVLIIHPFIQSIQHQIDQREKIWPGKAVLPEFSSVEFVKAVQSNAGGKTQFADWFEALEFMKSEIIGKDFDVAIIGAGAYGLPLAAFVKEQGKQAIQMSGATQILFGIKGKRWDEHPIISKFYNENWIRPSENETPPAAKKVEGGSYW